jgi:hypothetical protein
VCGLAKDRSRGVHANAPSSCSSSRLRSRLRRCVVANSLTLPSSCSRARGLRAAFCSLDVQRAVQLAEEAVTITLAHEPDRARRLVILADVLSRRSQLGDLDRVIQLREDALTFTRMDDYLRPHQLNQLAKSLLLRSRHASSTANLDRAIQLEATALELSWVPSACNDGGGHLRVGRCSGNGYANVP